MNDICTTRDRQRWGRPFLRWLPSRRVGTAAGLTSPLGRRTFTRHLEVVGTRSHSGDMCNTQDPACAVAPWSPSLATDGAPAQRAGGRGFSAPERAYLGDVWVGKETVRRGGRWLSGTWFAKERGQDLGVEAAFIMAGWGGKVRRQGPHPAPALARKGQRWGGPDLAARVSFVERGWLTPTHVPSGL